MKTLIIFLTILISTIFSNLAFADMIISGQEYTGRANPHKYDNNLSINEIENIGIFILLFLILITGIFIYKRKKSKKG